MCEVISDKLITFLFMQFEIASSESGSVQSFLLNAFILIQTQQAKDRPNIEVLL